MTGRGAGVLMPVADLAARAADPDLAVVDCR
jgi:hypothetical protein